jgi:ATP-dependent DNA helicase RecG
LQGENQSAEFKASFQKEVIESVVAFANSNGGKILIGISDGGKLLGLDTTNETVQQYINTIKQNTQPSIIVDIDLYAIENKNILIIDVKEYPIKPISYKNRYYKRIKNSNHSMNLDEIANEHLKTINASLDYYIDDRHYFRDISQENI